MNWFAGKSRTITGSGSLTPYSINKALNLALGLFMVFAVAFFIFAGSARAQPTETCPYTLPDSPTDKDILILFYCATDGENWANKDGWLTDASLANWHGVQLKAGRVSSLQLRYNELSGPIPPELGNLTGLDYLHLSGNQLTGTIPAELGNLPILLQLYLPENQLTGTIPTELGNLVGLHELDLNHNKLTGSIPTQLGNLSGLVILRLESNELTGTIPTELGNLTGLSNVLFLSQNQLTGTIPTELGKLTVLQSLYLWGNELTGTIPAELGTLAGLRELDLAQNQLTGTIPTELGDLAGLERLALSQNQLTGTIPTELGKLTVLQSLYLWGNELTGTIPAELGTLAGLRELDLAQNQLTGTIPTELGKLTALRYLYLWGNELTGTIPAELGDLTSLLELSLSRNMLSGTIPTELGELAALQYLYLWGNELTGTIPAELGDLTSLVELSLSRNMLSGTIPTQLGNLTSLKYLYLDNNMLTGSTPATELGTLANLQELGLWGNEGLTWDTISNELGKRVDRAVLWTLYNVNGGEEWTNNEKWFSPEETEIFSFSSWYGVSTDDTTGRVSALNLGNNGLKEDITNALEALDGLVTLNLSSNASLGGTLPVGMTGLTDLATLNIKCTDIKRPTDMAFDRWLASINDFTDSSCIMPPPPSLTPPESSAGTVSVVEDDGEVVAVAISPKNGGPVSLGNGKTIKLTIDRTEAPSQSGDPAIILPLEVLEEISEISFKISEASPEVPPSGFRLAGIVVEIEIDYELGAGETATVCLPAAAGVGEDAEIFHYNEETGMWESLESWLATVNGTPSVCAETDSFSFFGVFVAEPEQDTGSEGELDAGQGGCSISSDAEAGGVSQRALFNLLFIMSVLIAALWRNPSRGTET